MAVWHDYTWIVVCGCLAAFFTAYGIGANDVANAFGSSVAARTLTMRQALLIATVCEFGGSVLLGGEVTRTVAGGIARLEVFEREPQMYMYGMLCALTAAGAWLILATYMELPVSTTHSIVGAVMGYAFVYGGPGAVVWLEPSDAFPYMRGMVPIVVSWFTGPLLSGLASAALFLIVRTAILRRENSLQLAFWALPVLVLFTVFINVYFVIYKGANKELEWSSDKCAWIAACAAGGCTILTVLLGMPLVRKYVYEEMDVRRRQQVLEMESPVGDGRGPSSLAGTGAAGGGGGRASSRNMRALPGDGGGAGGGGDRRSGSVRSLAAASAGAAAAAAERASHHGPRHNSGSAGGGGVGGGSGGDEGQGMPGFTSPFVEYASGANLTTMGRQQHQQQHQQHQQQQYYHHQGQQTAEQARGSPPRPLSTHDSLGRSEHHPGGTVSGGSRSGGSGGGSERQGQQLHPQQQQQHGLGQGQPAQVEVMLEPTYSGSVSQGSPALPQGGSGGFPPLPPHAGAAVEGDTEEVVEGGGPGGGGVVGQAPAAAGGGGGGGGGGGAVGPLMEATGAAGMLGQQRYWQQQHVQPQQQVQQHAQRQQQEPHAQWQQQGTPMQQQQLWQQHGQQAMQEPVQQWQQQGKYGQQYGQQQEQYWQQHAQQGQVQQQQQWGHAQQQYNQQQQQWQQQPQNNQQQWQHHPQQQQQWYNHHQAYGSAAVQQYGDATANGRRQLTQPGPIAEAAEWGRKSVGAGYAGGGGDKSGAGLKGEAEDYNDDGSYGDDPPGQHAGNVHWQNTFDQLKAIVLHGTNVNVHDAITTDHATQRIHAHAEVFDPATEHAFKYLQVVTAICDSFSHGANDVANAVGPFTAIWYIYRYQRVDFQADLPVWILVLGGAGIVVGLGTYGYNIIRAIGVRLSVITPSRGFCIELSTALVVALASKYGLPISTTHCQVGATAGMGLMEGSAGLNWKLWLQFFLGWVVTLVLTGVVAAALFAAGAYAPSVQEGRAIMRYEDAMLGISQKLDLLLNRTNHAGLNDPALWGTFSGPLNQSLAVDLAAIRTATTPGSSRQTRQVQYIEAAALVDFVDRTVATYVNNSLPYMGGMPAKGQVLPRRP